MSKNFNHYNMNKLLLTAVCLLGYCCSFAQGDPSSGAVNITLPEAIEMAKKQSPVAKSVSSFGQSNYWKFRAAKAARYPQLSANGDIPGLDRSIRIIYLPDGTQKFVPVSQATSSAMLTLNQNITATGGNLFIGTGVSRIDYLGGTASNAWRTVPLQITLNQPLLKFNDQKWSWKQDQMVYSAGTRAMLEQMEDLSVEVAQRFFDYYAALNDLRNAESNASINDTIFKISEGRFNLGKIAENDLLQSELTLINARSSVEQARIRLNNNENILKNLLGFPVSRKLDLYLPAEIPPITDISVEKALEEARSNRSDFINFDLQEVAARMNVKQAEAAQRFSSDLTISYGLNQTATEFSAAYKHPLDQRYLTMRFNVPLVSWGKNHADYMAAKAGLEGVLANIGYRRSMFDQDVIAKVYEYKQLQSGLLISAKADTIARKRYEVTKNRYLIGKIDMTNLIIAQNEKDLARSNYIVNLQKFWVAYYQLRRLTLYDFVNNRKIGL
jgi:outer membrane protein TolC